LVAVSNRVGAVRGTAAAGGLAIALAEALRENGDLWFGWSGKTCAPRKARLHTEKADDLIWVHDFHLFPLASQLRRRRPLRRKSGGR
jgi:trehalose-6-phosphate synthase